MRRRTLATERTLNDFPISTPLISAVPNLWISDKAKDSDSVALVMWNNGVRVDCGGKRELESEIDPS